MSDDLTEINERIQVARTEATALDDLARTFCTEHLVIRRSSVGFAALANPSSEADEHNFYIKQTAPIPTPIRSKVGTVINELRSCLDGLACVLAVRNGKTTGGTYFPISKSKAIFDDDGMRKIAKLSDADKAKIINLKPYRDENPVLFGLHEADRTRKHIRLGAFGASNGQAIVGGNLFHIVGNTTFRISGSTINGTYVRNMLYWNGRPIEALNTEYEIATGVPSGLPMHIGTGISFLDPDELSGHNIIATIDGFADKVTEIVQLFE